MAANTNIFTEKQTNNWFKAYIALNWTKEGLTDFVVTELLNVQKTVGSSCGQCFIQNLIPCPTQDVCKKGKRTNCSFHNSLQYKSCQTCDKVKQNIKSLHRFNGPSWANTKAERWAIDPWEIGKCYLPRDGYISVSSVQASDFNGVISIMLNCTHFQTCVSTACLSPPPPDKQCPLEKVRQIGRDVRHTANCKVTDADLQYFFLKLSTLLADPVCLVHDPSATEARRKLSDLQNDRISLVDLGKLLKEANQILTQAKEAGERFSEEAERTLKEGLDAIEAKILAGEQSIENKTQAGEQSIENKTQESINRIKQAANEKELDEYDRGVADLLSRLIDHYRDTVICVPLSTLNHSLDIKVQDIYAKPKIHRMEIERDGKHVKQEQIYKYRDCFCGGFRRIYLQGEPGSGKSYFAAKLVHDWCNVHAPIVKSTKEQMKFGDVDTLQKFRFLFFISLRDSREQTHATQMIKTQLIYKIYAEDEWDSAYKLALKIMKNVMYLVVQDGLDEWPGEEVLPSMDGIPNDHCIVLTTSRPWKLADERIRNSQIDVLFDLEGISDPKEFNEKVLRCLLDESADIKKRLNLFEQFLSSRNLQSTSSSPMLNTLVLCTWVDDRAQRLTGPSLCELYTTLLENVCKKANSQISYFDPNQTSPVKCFNQTMYVKPNMKHIDAIAKAAFSFLLSNEKESSLVFSDIHLMAHLSPTAKQFALDSGLLSQRKGKKCTDQTLSFVHKTIQEFLAAFHIHRNADIIDDVISGYLLRNDKSYRDISQIFIFLCGFNISAANKLSAMMNELDVYSEYGHYFQDCILSGYKETVANKNTPIHLHLSNYKFSSANAEDLIQIWKLNTSRARSLKVNDMRSNIHVTRRSQYTSSADCHEPGQVALPAREGHGPSTLNDEDGVRSSTLNIELDLSLCHNLELLTLAEIGDHITVQLHALVGLKKLKYLRLDCKCEAIDLSHFEHIQLIDLNKRVTLLPLSINNYKNLQCVKLDTTYDGLDLSLFENLKSIEISNKVKVLPKPLLIHNKITKIELNDFEFNSLNNEAIYTWCLLNGADPVQCADYTPVLPS
ncbi:hypothetical protein DPMN_059420 [Dreissena polymorpha]|uniref:NACHT domain-containing protein n=1 Tax=Dreissena polymorpha TaxID=45954 RepID=A0A9D4C3Y6_DREPO|nr:hypothetical protein DPMN_059420 [Dreissena polymorpha]